MLSKGNWLRLAEHGELRYIDLEMLTSVHFSNDPTSGTSFVRRAELVVDGQAITLVGKFAQAAEDVITNLIAPHL